MIQQLHPSGTEGYAEQADALIGQYESIRFEDAHRPEMHLLPAMRSRVLDVGAGSGRDAAWFAAQGHSVVAVEPTHELRAAAMKLHPSSSIEWVDDALPRLESLANCGFDLILLSAVWIHLDASERAEAMPRLARLLSVDGILIMTLRHGPVPAGRRMFEVSGDETIELARRLALTPVLHARTDSLQTANLAAGVTWTRLAFKRKDR